MLALAAIAGALALWSASPGPPLDDCPADPALVVCPLIVALPGPGDPGWTRPR